MHLHLRKISRVATEEHGRFLSEIYVHGLCTVLPAFAGYSHSYKMNMCSVNILTEFFICTSKNDLNIGTILLYLYLTA